MATAAIDANGDLVIEYSVDSAVGNSAYPLHIEFFIADSDGEEGQTFLGSDSYVAGSAQSAKVANLGNAATLSDSSSQ